MHRKIKYKKRRVKPKNKRGHVNSGGFKVLVCVLILFAGLILKFGSSDNKVRDNISKMMTGSFDYKNAAETIGRAVSGEEDIVSVFKEITKPTAEEVSSEIESVDASPEVVIDEGFYNTYTLEDEESTSDVQATYSAESAEIEKLSFEMSEAELSDDTKAEPFVIPPPSNCSYDNITLGFKTTVPVYGKITSPYGYRDHPVGGDAGFHTGMDIAASAGTAVKAFAAGKVIEAGNNKIYGNYVLIEHASGIRSFYGHNSKLKVKKGQSVKLGEKIAEVGSTGLSTGPHLHFEVRKGSIRLNPKYYISPESI